MNASLNEIESLCKKAARGAGLSWGLAEEAGKAARWLSAHGLNGPALLAAQLQRDDGCAYPQLVPQVGAQAWQVPGQVMCPLIAGVTLSDHAYLLRSSGQIQLMHVAHPQLLMPFVSATARQLNLGLLLSWEGCRLVFSPDGGTFLKQPEGFADACAAQVSCTCITTAMDTASPLAGTIPDLPEAIQTYLDHLAARTYVPASEASRLLGAGSGLSDNN